MSPIPPDNQLSLHYLSIQSDTAPAAAEKAAPKPAASRSSSPRAQPRRPSLTLPGFAPRSAAVSTPAAQRAFTQPTLPSGSTLKVPAQAARAQTTSQLGRIAGPSPASTFADLLGATVHNADASAHLSTAKALAIVIQTGEQGLKTIFGYDAQGHVAFGSHDELEMNKEKSTQHQNLLHRVGQSIKADQSLDADIRKFGGDLFKMAVLPKAAGPKGVHVGGTRLKQMDDGSLTFTVSEALGFANVTPEVLEPVAQFHANVLRLAGMADKKIQGDGDATDALALRVTQLLA